MSVKHVLLGFVVSGVTACSSDAQDIREANDAARSAQTPIPGQRQTDLPAPTRPVVEAPKPLRAEVGALDVREGD